MAVIITVAAAGIILGGRFPVPTASFAAAVVTALPPTRARRVAAGATRLTATASWVSGLPCPQVSEPGRFSISVASRPQRSRPDRDYQCREEGSHPQLIPNEEVLRQKLDYIHENPVKRGYVDDPLHWRNSSARNYAGLPGVIPVYTDWV